MKDIIAQPCISILLASYNGEKYLEQQLETISGESQRDIQILISDDSSLDETLTVVEQFKANHDNVKLLYNETEEKGHKGNFTHLCNVALEVDSDCFCFSDQDDVWHPEKLNVLYTRMVALEKRHGKNIPILIHSDLCVVDERLNEIASSFIKYQGLPNPIQHKFPEFLYQNVVTGCTCMFNRALLELAAPIPKEAIVHDWWFALCAQYYGVIDFIDKPLVKYRQHANNAIGASLANNQYSLLQVRTYKVLLSFPVHIKKSILQSAALIKIASTRGEIVRKEELECVQEFSVIRDMNINKRVSFVNKYMKIGRNKKEILYLYFIFILIKWL